MKYWASQLGSFNKNHIYKHNRWLGKQVTENNIQSTTVQCHTLNDTIRKVGVPTTLLIDVEGLDCSLMRSYDFCASPQIEDVAFEPVHCKWTK